MAVEIYSNTRLISSSTSLFNQTIGSDYSMNVFEDGIASKTQISNGGQLNVYSRGITHETEVSNRGRFTVNNAGIASDTFVGTLGSMTLSSGAIADNTIVTYGFLTISNGAIANTVALIAKGSAMIYSGGTANMTTVYSGGNLDVYSGGIANNVLLNASGNVNVYSKGAVNSVILSSSAKLNIYNGGQVNNTTIDHARLNVSGGALVQSNTINAGAEVHVYNGGVAASNTVSGTNENGSGLLQVSSGGLAYSNTVLEEGYINVLNGGLIRDTEIFNGGTVDIRAYANASGTNVLEGGLLNVYGTVDSTTVNSDGVVMIYESSLASNTIISSGGAGIVDTLGSAVNTTIYKDGTLGVIAGSVNSTTVNESGTLAVLTSGTADNTTVNSNGDLYVYTSGTANNTTVGNGGTFVVTKDQFSGNVIFTGGAANNTTVQRGGNFVIDCGIASNTVIEAGANVTIDAEGIHRGTISFGEGAVISVKDGGIIDFSISGEIPAEPLISNLAAITGAPTYTVSLARNQKDGTYKLAANAADFTGSITIKDSTATYGTLTVGRTLKRNDTRYTLNVNQDENLILTIGVAADVNSHLLENGISQIVGWDAAQGKVGYVANEGNVGPAWKGIWDWVEEDNDPNKEAYISEKTGNVIPRKDVWRVAGVGHFSGSVVDRDGLLLYNADNNTFAAWTDLNDGSYGYVSLGYVDGNFNTKCLADFDGDDFDDVVIYNEKGSFGIMMNAERFVSVWDVTDKDPATKNWQLEGAGNFGHENGNSFVMKNVEANEFYLWHNGDASFKTWDWTQEVIGMPDNTGDWTIAGIGDFQGDGIDDIIVWDKKTGYMYAWENGDGTRPMRWVGSLDSNDWEIAAVGDYNGDGREDLLLREWKSGWGGLGYWGAGNADNWVDLNARVETNMESAFTIVS